MNEIFQNRNLVILIIAIALPIGGVIGALIYAAIDAYRHRQQPIGRRVDTFPHFEDLVGSSSLRKNITISDGHKFYKYEHLHIIQIQLSNQSDLDFDEFKFGITLSDDDGAIYIESQSPDRHHQVEQLTSLGKDAPQSKVDFALRPFNKRDTYSLRLLLVNDKIKSSPGEIDFSSPEAVKFVALPTVTEVVGQAARSASLSLGPLSISLD